jgi:putative transposase
MRRCCLSFFEHTLDAVTIDLPSAEWPRDYDSLDHGKRLRMPLKKHKPEEIIGKLREVEIVLAQTLHTIRPHSSLGYRPPAPETAPPPYPASGSASLHLRPDMRR